MNKSGDYNGLLSDSISAFLKQALNVLGKNPSMAGFLMKTVGFQKKASQIRDKYREEGLQVPPYMIISITNRCNLHCRGCYSQAQHRPADGELSLERLQTVISDGRELGISFIFLAGGEPLIRPEVIEAAGNTPEVLFPLFTNGLLITDETAAKLKKYKNIVPVISIEGCEEETDERRGQGVFNRLRGTIDRLNRESILYGFSFTVTSRNIETISDEAFISGLIDSGCRLFFFVEYIPVREGTEELVITDQQRTALAETLKSFKARLPGLFVSFPGDEEAFGGCLSAGRGFIHISAEGDLEPCPFAPYSDTNIKNMPLKEALRSGLLDKIRQNHSELTETSGGCALWEKREWVSELLKNTK